MKAIYEKALEEVASISSIPQIKDKFSQLTQKKWMAGIDISKFPSYGDHKHLGLTKLLERMLARNILTKSEEIWLWQSFIQQCFESNYPYTGFTFLLLGDVFFQQQNKIDKFYTIPDGAINPYQKFFKALLTQEQNTLDLLQVLKVHLPIEDDMYSQTLRTLTQEIKEKLPDPVEETKEEESQEKKQEQSAGTSQGTVVEKVTVEKNPLLDHPFFSSFLLPQEIQDICKAVMDEKISDMQIFEIFSETKGIYSWRHRFIKNLVMLSWFIDKGREVEVANVLKSLWNMVFLLAGRDKKDITLDSPQDIVLAMWEPSVYIHLVRLTIDAFSRIESFKEKKFEIVTLKIKINQDAIEKLKNHPFMLGFFNS